MKYILLFFMSVSFLFSSQNVLDFFNKAKKEKKLVYLFVGERGCPWCYAMDKRVIPNENVQKYLKKYAYLKVFDSRTLPKKFKVHFYPTSFIIDPQDNNFIIKKFKGYIGAKPLSKSLKEYLELYK